MTPAAVVIAIITGLIVNEFCDVSPWAAHKLVRWSAHRCYDNPVRAEERAEELEALIDDRPGKLFKLLTSLGFAIKAVAVLTHRAVMQTDDAGKPQKSDTGTVRPLSILLWLVSVQPDRCPPAERVKYYLLATCVLLDALMAAFAVPAGMSVVYPGMHVTAKVGLALLSFSIVGVISSIVVGSWVSGARYRINPPDDPPPFPGSLRRFGALIPGLVTCSIMSFGIGFLLTLSFNSDIIGKQAALDTLKNRDAAVTAVTFYDRAVRTDIRDLRAAVVQLVAAQELQTVDANRASCELIGKPRVPGCSLQSGAGPSYRHFKDAVNGPDQKAVNSAQASVSNLETRLENVIVEKARSEHLIVATGIPTGLSAVEAEWNQCADIYHLSWLDRHLIELMVLSITLAPLGMKLFGGTTMYETDSWLQEWSEAVREKNRRRAEQRRAELEALFPFGSS
jgi:hypothetical protein